MYANMCTLEYFDCKRSFCAYPTCTIHPWRTTSPGKWCPW